MDYKKLFNSNCSILDFITQTATFMRKQDYDSGIRIFRNIVVTLQDVTVTLITEDEQLRKDGIEIDNKYLLQLLSDIIKAQEEKDYILMADLLELTLQPFFVSLQELIRQTAGEVLYNNYFDVNIEALAGQDAHLAKLLKQTYAKLQKKEHTRVYTALDGVVYSVEDTQFGYPTLKIVRKEKSYYLHSNCNPVREGELFAESCWNKNLESVHICGAGLLYHVFPISNTLIQAYPIHIYEADCNVLAIAMTVFDISQYIQKKYFYFHYDASMLEFSKAIADQSCGFAIHHPSLQNIGNASIKNSMEKFFIAENTARNQKQLLTINFLSNIKNLQNQTNNVMTIDRILSAIKGKDVYIIAAGPSLDKNIELIKMRPENSLILATGTVFYKMMQMGIRPDWVIITDPNERVIWQIRQQEQEEIPMLLLSTANRNFIEMYRGPKYLVFQKDFPMAEEMADQLGSVRFETGGSVSTAALDVALRGKAARVIFLGLDLAFTDNLAHAEVTSNRMASNGEDLISIKDFNGGKVLTDYKFMIYKEWIERRIKEEDDSSIEIINATEGGAYIQGMHHMLLSDIIDNQ